MRLIADWERAFAQLSIDDTRIELAAFGRGSWWREWFRSERAKQTVDSAERALEVAALGVPESEANRSNAEAIAKLAEGAANVSSAVIISGSIVFVKLTDADGLSTIAAETLTATQLKEFRSQRGRLQQPASALQYLESVGTDAMYNLPALGSGLIREPGELHPGPELPRSSG